MMERFDKDVRAVRGLCPLAQRNLPINHWVSYVAQACSVAPPTSLFFSFSSFFSPLLLSLCVPIVSGGEGGVLEVAVRDT